MMVQKVIEEGTDAQFKRCLERLDFKFCEFCKYPLVKRQRGFSKTGSYYYCLNRADCQERWSFEFETPVRLVIKLHSCPHFPS